MSGDCRYEEWWGRHRVRIFQILIVVMAVMAVLKIGDEFRRLLWDPSFVGAVDLRHMHRWIWTWFAGKSLFQVGTAALYPPATYLMLWPLLGWISFETARWVWAVASIAALGLISFFAIRISGAEKPREKIFAVLLILSINGTGVAIGSGQFILLILPALLGAALVIENEEKGITRDVVAGGLITWTLIKPSIAAPFIWIFLFRRNHWRAVLVTLLLYAVLTFASAATQKDDLTVLLGAMLNRATDATTLFPGTRNLHAVLVAIGRQDWITFSSAVVFFGLGVWVYFFRRVDQWVLIGVTALVARMWTYHRVYDDGLILLAELALWRIARTSAAPRERMAGEMLLTVNAFVMLCPARFLDNSEYAWSAPWMWLCTSGQAVVWLLTLGFLINYARANASPPAATA